MTDLYHLTDEEEKETNDIVAYLGFDESDIILAAVITSAAKARLRKIYRTAIKRETALLAATNA